MLVVWCDLVWLFAATGTGVNFGGSITSAATNSSAAAVSAVTLTMTVPPGLVKLMAGAVFPIGLMFVVICGAELFTGNMMYLTLALYTGKTTWRKAAINLFVVYFGNLVGSLIFAYFFTYLTDTISAEPWLSVRVVRSLVHHQNPMSASDRVLMCLAL